MSSKRIVTTIEAHARTLMLTLAMLIAVFAAAPARAQGPSDVLWVAPERASHRANPVLPTTDVLKKGHDLFHRDCEQCHGKAGHGDGPQAAFLATHPADLAELVQAQSDGSLFYNTP